MLSRKRLFGYGLATSSFLAPYALPEGPSLELVQRSHTAALEAPDKISILSFNVHGGRSRHGDERNVAGLLRLLSVQRPDVACLQEVTQADVYRIASAQPDSSIVYSRTYYNQLRSGENKTLGNATILAANMPLDSYSHLVFPASKQRPARSVLITTSSEVTVINLHLESHVKGLRDKQAERLYHDLGSRAVGKKLIVCGDFNARADEYPRRQLASAGMRDLNCSGAYVDTIAAAQDLTIEPCTILKTGRLSDHKPVVANVYLS